VVFQERTVLELMSYMHCTKT